MTDSQTPPSAAPLPAFANPVLAQVPGGFQSAMERHSAQVFANGENTPPPVGGSEATRAAAALEAARSQDRQQSQPPASQQQRAPENAPAGDDAEKSMLQMRPRTRDGREVRKASDWDTIKTERDNARQELQTLRAQLHGGAAPGSPGTNGAPNTGNGAASTTIDITQHEAFKALKAERDIFYEEIKHVRVEADPEFRAKFDSRRDAAYKIIKGAAGAGADDVLAILKDGSDSRNSRLAERIKDFSDTAKSKILAVAGQLDVLDVERQIEIESRRATWEHTQASRDQVAAQRQAARFTKLDSEFENVLATWSDPQKGMPFMIDDKIKATVVPAAKQIFSGEATPRGLAEASLKAALFPELLKMAMQAYGEIERINGSNDRYRNSYPGSENGNFNSGAPSNEPPALRLDTVDPHMYRGLEEARARDRQGKGY